MCYLSWDIRSILHYIRQTIRIYSTLKGIIDNHKNVRYNTIYLHAVSQFNLSLALINNQCFMLDAIYQSIAENLKAINVHLLFGPWLLHAQVCIE